MDESISELLEKYSFLELKPMEFKELTKIINDNDNKNEICPNIKKFLMQKTIKRLDDSRTSKKTVEKIINSMINEKSTLFELEKLITFLEEHKYELNENHILEIFKFNNNFYNLLEDFEKKNELGYNNLILGLLNYYYMYTTGKNKNNEVSIIDDSTKLYLHEVFSYVPFTPQEEQKIFREYNNTTDEKRKKELEEEIVKRNLRLVVSIARNYTGNGLEFLELCNEGTIGLIKAISKFDYQKGNKFSTYEIWWIRAKIRKALNVQSRFIRIPDYKIDIFREIQKYYNEFVYINEEEPTVEKLCSYISKTDIERRYVLDYFECLKNYDLLSLNHALNNETEEDELESIISDNRYNTEKDAIDSLSFQELNYIINNSLSYEERFIFKYRNELNEENIAFSQYQLGILFQNTKVRIGQKERQIKEKLKKAYERANLKPVYTHRNFKNNTQTIEIEDVVSKEEIIIMQNYLNTYFQKENPNQHIIIEKNITIKNIINKLLEFEIYEEFLNKYCSFIYERINSNKSRKIKKEN